MILYGTTEGSHAEKVYRSTERRRKDSVELLKKRHDQSKNAVLGHSARSRRLDNLDAQDWKNCIQSQLHLLPGESGAMGFAMYRSKESYDGPKMLTKMRTKPDGYREHWRKFDPARIETLRLVIRSATPKSHLGDFSLSASYPYLTANSSPACVGPLLDKLGADAGV